MGFWLVKSEPHTWSWQQQVQRKTTHWDGVRNYQAASHLKAMKQSDLAFFYHSNEQRQIMGIVRVVREAYPDPTDPTGRFVMVDVTYESALNKPVTLAQVKAHPLLQHLALVRQSRLSVMPIDPEAWDIICKLGG